MTGNFLLKFKDNLELEAGLQEQSVGRQSLCQSKACLAAGRLSTNVTDGRAQHTPVFWHTAGTAYHWAAPVSLYSKIKVLGSWTYFASIFCLFHTVPSWLSILWGLHPGQLAAQENWDVHSDLVRADSPSPTSRQMQKSLTHSYRLCLTRNLFTYSLSQSLDIYPGASSWYPMM